MLNVILGSENVLTYIVINLLFNMSCSQIPTQKHELHTLELYHMVILMRELSYSQAQEIILTW